MSHFISNHSFISNRDEDQTAFSIPIRFQTFGNLVLITKITVQNSPYKFSITSILQTTQRKCNWKIWGPQSLLHHAQRTDTVLLYVLMKA